MCYRVTCVRNLDLFPFSLRTGLGQRFSGVYTSWPIFEKHAGIPGLGPGPVYTVSTTALPEVPAPAEGATVLPVLRRVAYERPTTLTRRKPSNFAAPTSGSGK